MDVLCFPRQHFILSTTLSVNERSWSETRSQYALMTNGHSPSPTRLPHYATLGLIYLEAVSQCNLKVWIFLYKN